MTSEARRAVRLAAARRKGGWLRAHGRLDRSARVALARFWRRAGDQAAATLTARKGRADAADLFPLRERGGEFRRATARPRAAAAWTGVSLEQGWIGDADAGRQAPRGVLAFDADDAPAGPPAGVTVAMSEELEAEVATFLRTRGVGVWNMLGPSTHRAIRDTLRRGLADGDTLAELAARVRRQFRGWEDWRARRLARTETTAAMNAGGQAARRAAGIERKAWSSVFDRRTRRGRFDHLAPDGQEVPERSSFVVSRERLLYPGDISLGASGGNVVNCFLPGTLVAGRVLAVARALYDGQAVEVVTHGGAILRVTENHPVAAPHGFIRAGALQQGQQVFRDVSGDDAAAGDAGVLVPAVLPPDQDHAPARVEQLFDAMATSAPGERRRCAPDDLHGDGRSIHGEVHVVVADRGLLRHGESGPADDCRDLRLVAEAVGAATLAGDSPLPLPGGRISPPAASGPRADALLHDGGAVPLHAGPFRGLRLGPVSQLNAAAPKHPGEGGAAQARFVRQLFEARPGLVVADQVREVRGFRYHGPVYDVQTAGGWLSAGGIIAHNCRCISYAVLD